MNVHINHSTMLERHILHSTCSTSTLAMLERHVLLQYKSTCSTSTLGPQEAATPFTRAGIFFCHSIAEVKSLFVIKLFSNICSNSIIYNKFKYVINLKINSLCPLHGILAYNTSYRSSANLVTTCN